MLGKPDTPPDVTFAVRELLRDSGVRVPQSFRHCGYGSEALQLGAALAVQLFDDGGTWGTAALRLLMAAAVLLPISRPKVRAWGREQWLAAAALGLSLGMMNGFFYAAIALIIMTSVLQTMVPARGTKPKLRRVPWKAHRRSRAKVG
ncbi:hypothetical protein QP414_00800 [Corynebacterium simulans]|uniref:hypothetical protein n=1 Tax=Corynebacterium simulans TaxID=146827 RepID=UPI00254D3BA5|nr:hypothetical protein [Corynebacterium simulans]MDK7137847.1 hypothetical protein [Corynebacterium simulans]